MTEKSRNTQKSFDPEELHFDDKSIMSADRSFDPENILYSASGRIEGYRASDSRNRQVLPNRISFASSKSYDPEFDFGSRGSKNASFDPERFSFASENSFDPERSTWDAERVQALSSQISLDPEVDEEQDLPERESARGGAVPPPVDERRDGATDARSRDVLAGNRAEGRSGQDISHLSALLRSALEGMSKSEDPFDDKVGQEGGGEDCKREASRQSIASFDPELQGDRSKICSTVLSFDPERELSLLCDRRSPMSQADGDVGGLKEVGGSNILQDRQAISFNPSAAVCVKVGQESGRFIVRSCWGDAQEMVDIGDELVKVDGFLLLGQTLEQVEVLLQGEGGTRVEVELQSCMGQQKRVWLQRSDQVMAEVSRQFSVPTIGSPPSGVYGRIDPSVVIQQLEVKYKSALLDAIQQRSLTKQLEERVLELEGKLMEAERKR